MHNTHKPEFDFMTEILKHLAAFIGKQLPAVSISLLMALAVLWLYASQRQEWRTDLKELEMQCRAQNAAAIEEVKQCRRDKEALYVEVAALRERINLLMPRYGARR